MKKTIITLMICAGLSSCTSNRATNANDSASVVKSDTGKIASKPDTPGKSDGAGTGPSYGSGSKAPDSSGKTVKP
jgi:hypothetical protein